ncbi:MAG: BamA/TamA family outer membrane protein [Saprospiraceae bacterium]|nr:BamA/TamA family outer membrane protein [Saprospiraceae bacterium]
MDKVIISVLVSWFCLPFFGTAQTDARSEKLPARVMNWLSQENKPPEKPRFLFYPTLGYSPETSLEIGVAGSVLFHAKNKHLENRLSEITILGFGTLHSQYGLWVDNAVYTDKDKWLILGRLRLQQFPLLYYGIGPDAPEEEPVTVNGVYYLLKERIMHRIAHNMFAGLVVDGQYLGKVDFGDGQPTRPLPEGAEGSTNLSAGIGLVYDSRPNMLNTRKGWFAELAWLHYSKSLGSDYAFENFSAEVRQYIPTFKNQVFAWQISGNIVSGNAPFNMLSLMGNESLMRGYYTGRYRDRHYYAAQAEYRFLPLPFSKRIGAAVFAGAGAVAPDLSGLALNNIRLTAGGGLRYLLFPKKDIFVRLDMGATREGVSFYIFTGEAF